MSIYMYERKISVKKLWLNWIWRAIVLYVVFSFGSGFVIGLVSRLTNTRLNPALLIAFGFASAIFSSYLSFKWVLKNNDYIIVKNLKGVDNA